MSNTPSDADVAHEVVGPAAEGSAVALIAPLQIIEVGLAALRIESDEADWDVETTDGERAAREFRAKCVKVRTSADAAYEQGNKPLLAAQRQARELVKKIQSFVQPIEDVWDAKIKAKEQRKAAEKAAREQAERDRIRIIRGRIDDFTFAASSCAGCTSEQIKSLLDCLDQRTISKDLFGEFVDEAEGARLAARSAVQKLYDDAAAREAEAARLQAEREELARQAAELAAQVEAQRAEQARIQREAEARLAEERRQFEAQRAEQERAAREAEAAAAEERRLAAEALERAAATARAEQARLDAIAQAERERQAAELKAQIDAFEAEKRAEREKVEAQLRAQREAEAQRLAAIKAAEEAAEAQRRAEELAEQERLAQAAKDARPSDLDILSVVCSSFGVDAATAVDWLGAFDGAAALRELAARAEANEALFVEEEVEA